MKSRPIDLDNLLVNRIQEVVWTSPDVETNAGHVVRSMVGLTDKGDYKVAYATLPETRGQGAKEYGHEIVDWDYQSHARKSAAISEARAGLGEMVQRYSRGEKSAAEKYGLTGYAQRLAQYLQRGRSR